MRPAFVAGTFPPMYRRSGCAQVFELGGDAIPLKMAHNLTRLIAEGAGEGDDAADSEMRAEVVATYLDLLDRPKLSDVLLMVRLQVAASQSIWLEESRALVTV